MVLKQRLKEYLATHRAAQWLASPLLYVWKGIQRARVRRRNRLKRFLWDSLFERVEGGTLIVRVPEFQGIFEFDARSHILSKLLRTGRFEPDLVQLVHQYLIPDRDVIDIGANVGLYTVLFARITTDEARVLAVEPVPSVLKRLHANLRRNQVETKVLVYEGVVTKSPGVYPLHAVEGLEEYSSLGDIVHADAQGPMYTLTVSGETVDHLVATWQLQPGFIKIDAEGAEHLVLGGAEQTLRQYRPVILTELSDALLRTQGTTSEAVVSLLQSCGYRVLDALHLGQDVRPPFEGTILALPEPESRNT
ncbi:FkbM family methyltransferase [Candidatus Parcubacteria bacterium]|nr:MAG: FkbM family methyltransferase [Candidatus Parcubacteria bacterium]